MNFIKNHHFVEKKNDFQDNQSVYNQSYLVGNFPIQNIPFIENKSLENYGIPAGLVFFKDSLNGGNSMIGGNKIKNSKLNNKNVIDDEEFNKLFENISIKNKKNKTNKNEKVFK